MLSIYLQKDLITGQSFDYIHLNLSRPPFMRAPNLPNLVSFFSLFFQVLIACEDEKWHIQKKIREAKFEQIEK